MQQMSTDALQCCETSVSVRQVKLLAGSAVYNAVHHVGVAAGCTALNTCCCTWFATAPAAVQATGESSGQSLLLMQVGGASAPPATGCICANEAQLRP